MSPTTPHPVLDSSGHPPVEAIAEYLEDLLPPDATTRLREHFADCAECLDTRAALQEVRSLLGQTETPVLPADIGIRIDAALAAEALLAATPVPEPGPDAAPAQPSTTTSSTTTAGTPPRKAYSPSSGRAAGARRPPGRPGRGRGRGWRRAALGVAALAIVGLVSTAVIQSGGHSDNGSTNSSAAVGTARAGAIGALPSLGTLTDANLTQQVHGLLLSHTVAQHPQAQTARSNAPAATPGGAPACVLAATGRPGETPLAAGQGVYQDTPVVALVYADAAHPLTSSDVYLVDASCHTGVLLHRTVPR